MSILDNIVKGNSKTVAVPVSGEIAHPETGDPEKVSFTLVFVRLKRSEAVAELEDIIAAMNESEVYRARSKKASEEGSADKLESLNSEFQAKMERRNREDCQHLKDRIVGWSGLGIDFSEEGLDNLLDHAGLYKLCVDAKTRATGICANGDKGNSKSSGS